MKNIAVFMPNFIGDSINATPAIKLIKKNYPQATIHLIVNPLVAPLFSRDDRYNVIIYDRSKNKINAIRMLAKQLKTKKVDACLLFTNKLIDAVTAKLAKSKVIVGYKNECRGLLLTHKLKLDRTRHYINRYAYLANLFCDNHFTKLPSVEIFYDAAQSILLKTDHLKIGISILSPTKPEKHYPVDKMVETIKLIHQQHKQCYFYLFGNTVEAKQAKQVMLDCNNLSIHNIISLAGETTVEQLIDSIATLDILISVDSSPLHIAAACDTQTFALVGKSPSPFSVVCPNSKLVKVAHNSAIYIEDNKQMLSINPSDIAQEVNDYIQQLHHSACVKSAHNQ